MFALFTRITRKGYKIFSTPITCPILSHICPVLSIARTGQMAIFQPVSPEFCALRHKGDEAAVAASARRALKKCASSSRTATPSRIASLAKWTTCAAGVSSRTDKRTPEEADAPFGKGSTNVFRSPGRTLRRSMSTDRTLPPAASSPRGFISRCPKPVFSTVRGTGSDQRNLAEDRERRKRRYADGNQDSHSAIPFN